MFIVCSLCALRRVSALNETSRGDAPFRRCFGKLDFLPMTSTLLGPPCPSSATRANAEPSRRGRGTGEAGPRGEAGGTGSWCSHCRASSWRTTMIVGEFYEKVVRLSRNQRTKGPTGKKTPGGAGTHTGHARETVGSGTHVDLRAGFAASALRPPAHALGVRWLHGTDRTSYTSLTHRTETLHNSAQVHVP